MNGERMKKDNKGGPTPEVDTEMRPHYDFRGGVRGTHAAQYAAGTNLVLLDDDVAGAVAV